MIKDLYDGADGYLHSIKGSWRRRLFKARELRNRAEEIVVSSEALRSLPDVEFSALILAQRSLANAQRKSLSGDALRSVLAVIAEASFRALGKRPYDVQMMSVLAMEQTYAIEMGTGEGKTIVAALATTLLAWKGQRCHVVTSNDYLAERDASALEGFYNLCGLRVSYLSDAMQSEERRQGYGADVLYATSNNLLADYLKDRLEVDYEFGSNQEKIAGLRFSHDNYVPVTKPLEAVVVDEADSVLADDAITPLIISMQEPDEELHKATAAAYEVVQELSVEEHYQVYPAQRQIRLTDAGYDAIDTFKAIFPEQWAVQYRYSYIVTQALYAQYLYEQNREYVVIDDEIVIVDEKTGRLMPSRTWSHGLHQAIEMKEGLQLSHPTRVSARMSFQNYFRMYQTITGMSGTFNKIERELWHIYHLAVVRIPLRLRRSHLHYPERVFIDTETKIAALLDSVQAVSAAGRPVLIGTRSIGESLFLDEQLSALGLKTTVLNALAHIDEAKIIAEAGSAGRITIATNMAGRGTDIVVAEDINRLGGLHVIATARNSSRRIDRQLFGRASRQGQAGSSETLLSLEDEMLRIHLPKWLQVFYKRYFQQKFIQTLVLGSYIFVQWITEWRASKMRVNILLQDIKTQKLMSFANK